MSEEAQHHKTLGNEAVARQDFESGIEHYTRAIALDPNDHVFYSNRCHCYTKLSRFEEAFIDAEKCVTLKPDWVKGFNRKSLAEFNLQRFGDAISTCSKGLYLDSLNKELKEILEKAKTEQLKVNSPLNALFTEANIVKLKGIPRVAAYFEDPSFLQVFDKVKEDPTNMHMVIDDRRFMECIGIILDVDIDNPQLPDKMTKEKKPVPEAEELKVQGNNAYKAQRYEEAIAFYDRAYEKDPEEIVYINNKAQVYLAMGDAERCIELCDLAVDRGRDVFAPSEKILRAMTRKAETLKNLGRMEEAIDAYYMCLTEKDDEKIRATLKELKKRKKQLERVNE